MVEFRAGWQSVIAVPEDFGPIRDSLVEHLLSGGSKPAELNKLRQWFLDEGWDELVRITQESSRAEILCFDPSHLDELDLSDDGLRGQMFLDDDETPTDEMRLQYAREALHSAYGGELAGGFESWCWPMIHVGQLVSTDGNHILVGILTRFQGPGSDDVAEWCDFFPDIESLTNRLKQLGYILGVVPEDIDPQILLNAWDDRA